MPRLPVIFFTLKRPKYIMCRVQELLKYHSAVSKALAKAKAIPNERHLKDKGIVQEECREMIRDLQTLNVPVEKLKP
jgi:hypothetical protein